jgi:hypothetical protein
VPLANNQGNRPLWNYVDILEYTTEGGRNMRFKCKFCTHEYNGSYARVRAHLLKISCKGIRMCPSVTDSTLRQLQNEVAAAEEH